MRERDFIELVDDVHQLDEVALALVRDRLNTHVSLAMRELIADHLIIGKDGRSAIAAALCFTTQDTVLRGISGLRGDESGDTGFQE
ncbi:hypothetical protein ACIP6P_24720 [Streptomyces sp. NPDC088729]|uniref:hypothetical protein n=1 Tax=Streptomyces sp. NPDC088729 TaxID=3365876 RepID=UPI0038015E86